MKRLWLVILAVGVVAAGGAQALRAASFRETPAPRSSDRSPGSSVASAVTTITGVAISPLLGTAGYGAYQWFSAKDSATRARLHWYAKPGFWLPALLIVGICAAKDAFGAAVPVGWKKPLDVLELLENKVSGLVAAGAVVPFTLDALSKYLTGAQAAGGAPIGLEPTGLAMLPFSALNLSWLLDLAVVPFGVAIFAVVWMASHAINVLILLSPWGAIDAALKSARTALLALLAVTAVMNPLLGALLSAVVIVAAYFLAGWAYRLTAFGTLATWDFLTFARTRFHVKPDENVMFAGSRLPGVPVRSYGRLVARGTEELEFVYRRLPFMPVRRAVVPASRANLSVGHGFFLSNVTRDDTDVLFLLPPRYRCHETALAECYRFGQGVRPAGLRKAWGALRELLGGRAAKPLLAADAASGLVPQG